MNAKAMMMALSLVLAAQTFAAVTITNVTCRQRYPWNGLVDIDYEIQSDYPDATFFVYPKGEDKRLGTPIVMHTLMGDGATNAVGVGRHRMIWDAKTDMPNFSTPDFAVKLQTISSGAQYLVVDLSGGTNAVTYPVRYSTTPPDVTTDKCRTTELWLRLILPGTFMMGSPTSENSRRGNEQQHFVRLTRPYYIGVFELTQKQWMLISGTGNAIKFIGDCRPIDAVSYDMIRGSNLGRKWPTTDAVDSTSFIGIIRSKTSLKFDLPTEAQWEYACRAGTTSAFNNNGSDAEALKKVGRFYYNMDDGRENYREHTKVGMYLPNAWGLYDMHGNVFEWCRDCYQAQLPSYAVVDPVGSEDLSSGRCYRSGCWWSGIYVIGVDMSQWFACRSACRFSAGPATVILYNGPSSSSTAYGALGFRLVCLPVE